jgi:hypothetical protein
MLAIAACCRDASGRPLSYRQDRQLAPHLRYFCQYRKNRNTLGMRRNMPTSASPRGRESPCWPRSRSCANHPQIETESTQKLFSHQTGPAPQPRKLRKPSRVATCARCTCDAHWHNFSRFRYKSSTDLHTLAQIAHTTNDLGLASEVHTHNRASLAHVTQEAQSTNRGHMKPKTDWSHISREISVALSTNPQPKHTTRKVVPIVVVRKSSTRVERAAVVLGRLA